MKPWNFPAHHSTYDKFVEYSDEAKAILPNLDGEDLSKLIFTFLEKAKDKEIALLKMDNEKEILLIEKLIIGFIRAKSLPFLYKIIKKSSLRKFI